MLAKKTELIKPIFRSGGTKTFCGDCAHVRGNASPNRIYWSCAAENVMGVPFQNNGQGEVVYTDTDCPLFQKNMHTLEIIMAENIKERMLSAPPEKEPSQPEEKIASPEENVLNWLIEKGHTAIRRKNPERVAATLKREIEKTGDYLVKEQRPGQESTMVNGQTVNLPFTNCFCTVILCQKEYEWLYAGRAAKGSKEFIGLMFIILDGIINKD